MKKAILIFLALSSLSFIDNQDIKSTLVSGKWFLDSIQEKGQEPEKVSDKENEWLYFYPDGKTEQNSFGQVSTCQWEYDKSGNLIKMKGEEGITILKIIEITEDELIVEQIETPEDSETLIRTYTK